MATKTICYKAVNAADKLFGGNAKSLSKHFRCYCEQTSECRYYAGRLLREFKQKPSEAAAFLGLEIVGVEKKRTQVNSAPVKKLEVKPFVLEVKPFVKPSSSSLIVNNETLKLVNSVEYPLEGFTHPKKYLLQGMRTVHKVFILLKQLGYDPVLATTKSVMDVGLASDIAIKWEGGWRLLQIKSSMEYAKLHFEKKGRGFQLHPSISALLPGIDSRKRWDCPECLIIVNGRLVCLNANGRGSYFPPALRADDYVVEKYNW